MTDLQQPNQASFLEEPKKMPDMLNVLTILTFVGCGLFGLLQIWGFARAKQSYETMLQLQGKLDDMPDLAKKFMGPDMLEIVRKEYENRVPILILGLVGFALCTYGALQMRQLKKAGFSIYTIGELLPIVSAILFMGAGMQKATAIISNFVIPAVFIILYATQLKYMKNK